MKANPRAPTLYTCGHGTLTFEALVGLLHSVPIAAVIDVRTYPRSRTNPQFNHDALVSALPAVGISYRWERRLGGFRKPRPDSPNAYWRHAGFRGYADHMQTIEFWEALDRVLEEARRTQAIVMCSEAVWWRCHRRLIADAAVLAREARVEHLFHDGRLEPHTVTAEARLENGVLSYPGEPTLLRPGSQQQ